MKNYFQIAMLALLSVLFFSCTKSELPEGEIGELPEGIVSSETSAEASVTPTAGDIAYGVNKTVLLQLINNVRQTGCNCGGVMMPPVAPVVWNDQVAQAAFAHSNDMKTKNFFSHTGSGGTNVGTRVTAQGYRWRAVGENIALGYLNEQTVMNGWLRSAGHCRNIMNSRYQHVGLGRVGNYWTQVFATKY